MRTTALATALALLLTCGCGWHLRGASDIPPLGSLFIRVGSVNAELVENLRQELQSGDVTLTDDPGAANYQLALLTQRSDQRTATVNVGARIAELMLTEEVDFQVLDRAGQLALPTATAAVERTFEYSETNALASDDESRLLSSEMQAELARQIVNRLHQVRKPAAPAPGPADAAAR